MEPVILKDLSLSALDDWLAGFVETPFRRRQIRSWLYSKGARNFGDMSDLPLALRDEMASRARLDCCEILESLRSKSDASVKYLLKLHDGETVGAVSMPGAKHATLCISSQVGCPLDCAFCATGRWGYRRNLSQGEILDQVLLLIAALGEGAPSPNLVFMGMGEPLLNFDALVGALRILGDEDGLGFGGRRIIVSTAGLPERIRMLAEASVKAGLALSLNAADDRKRAALMPVASAHSIAKTLDACEYFAERSQRRVTLEYVLMAGVNDSEQDARDLQALTRRRPFKVNIIPYNPGDEMIRVDLPGGMAELRRPSRAQVERFVGRLLPQVPSVTVRWSQGSEVGGACGQLRGRRIQGEASDGRD